MRARSVSITRTTGRDAILPTDRHQLGYTSGGRSPYARAHSSPGRHADAYAVGRWLAVHR